jgi:DNA-binding NarL/FixJ family response regulator
MKEHTILIGSESFLIRQGLMQLLKSVNVQFEVLEAETEEELYQQNDKSKPTILLLDPEVLQDVHQFLHDTSRQKLPVIAGICRNADSDDDKLFHKCIYLYDSKKSLIEKLQQLTEIQNEINGTQSSELSEREIAILKKVALGYTNKEISDQLHISPHTVVTHRKNITAKLGIKTISGLTVYALINNFISTEDVHMGS